MTFNIHTFRYLAAALIWGALCGQPAQAKLIGIFDIDGTVNNDEGPNAAWVTPYILQRVESIQTTIQQLPNDFVSVQLKRPEQVEYFSKTFGVTLPGETVQVQMPEQITMSYADFAANEIALAPHEGELGGLEPILLKFDPLFPSRALLIVPGYYRMTDDTYKYYRTGTGSRKKNYYLENLKASIKRAEILGGDYNWKGEAYPLLQAFMSDPETVGNVVYSSMRGQTAKEIYAGDDYLVEIGEFKYSKGTGNRRPKVFMHNDPKSRLWGRNGEDKKVKIPKRFLDSLRHSAGDKHWERMPDGTFKKMHTLIVSENDAAHGYNISQMLLRESGDLRSGRVKIVVHNAVNKALTNRIVNARFPWVWTVIDEGRRPRQATAQEIYDWHHFRETQVAGEKWAAAQAGKSCDGELVNGGLK